LASNFKKAKRQRSFYAVTESLFTLSSSKPEVDSCSQAPESLKQDNFFDAIDSLIQRPSAFVSVSQISEQKPEEPISDCALSVKFQQDLHL
jgi:hypothetical protein